MKICAACHKELPQESFSKKQWQMKRYRRCKSCIDVDRTPNPGEAKETGRKILSFIEEMRAANHDLPQVTIQLEMATHGCLGNIYLEEETKESAKAALDHFEKCRDLCHEHKHGLHLLAIAEDNLVRAKRECEGDSFGSIEEILKRKQAVYDSFVAVEPEGSTAAIQFGISLASTLYRSNRAMEAKRVLVKLAATCKRVHGPGHSLTKQVESMLVAGGV
ncbi:hypothetical protein ACHAXT_003487 [Thalassiosira profunda]